MKLCEIDNTENQLRNIQLMNANANRQAKQAKNAKLRLRVQKARERVMYAQQQLNLAIRAVHENP